MSSRAARLRLALGAALLLVAPGCQPGPAPGGEASPAPGSGPEGARVYVANQDAGSVTVVDGASHEVVATVDLRAAGYGGNPKPHHVAVEPDGSHWYVSLIGANRVLRLDRSNRVVGEAALDVPGMLALDPTGERVYVGRSMSAVNPPPRIGIIQVPDMSVDELSVFFPRPHALATHPRHPVVYAASLAENSLAVISPADEHVDVRPIPPPAGDHGHGVHTLVQWAIAPDGRTLVGTGEMSGQLLVYDVTDPAAPRLVTTVPVNARPWHPVFSPDGREVWFANKGANTVTVVETSGWTVDAVIEGAGLAEPHGAAMAPDGRHVFVSSNNLGGGYTGGDGALVVIDRAARTIVEVIPVGANAAGVATRAPR